MKDKTKNAIIIGLSILTVVLLCLVCYLLITKSNKLNELTGTVIVADSDYILLETAQGDYLINDIEDTYEIGDEVRIIYKEKNLDESQTPKRVKADKEELRSKNNGEHKNENDQKPNEPSTPEVPPLNDSQEGNMSSKPTVPTDKNADKEVLAYFDDLDEEFKSSNIKESLKNGFVTVVDFLFYDGKIKGHSFKDLSESAKLKVLSMALYFDGKIDMYFPGYKESISSTTGKIYTSAKDEIVETYLNVASTVCESNEELCKIAKEGFTTLKKNFGLTWNLIKDIAGDGLSKLKNWYEIWSEK